jgi:hypothetical protein
MVGNAGANGETAGHKALRKFGVVANWLSLEPLLKGYANGSTVILVRTISATLVFYFIGLFLRTLSYSSWPASFSWPQLGKDIGDTVPWLAAIAGGIYAALYTRFSSHWSYLAAVYHQIKQAQVGIVSATAEQKERWPANPPKTTP